jgi:hypothetical protein
VALFWALQYHFNQTLLLLKVDQRILKMEHIYGINCDLTLRCEPFVFHVHRDVISEASPVFMSLLKGPFAESSTEIIALNEDNPESLKLVIDVIYLGILGGSIIANIPNVDIDLDAIVNKYDLAGVRDFITHSRETDNIIRRYKMRELVYEKKCENLRQENKCFKEEMEKKLSNENLRIINQLTSRPRGSGVDYLKIN